MRYRSAADRDRDERGCRPTGEGHATDVDGLVPVCVSEFEGREPHPYLLELTVKRTSALLEDIWMIGAGAEADIGVAYVAGIDSMWPDFGRPLPLDAYRPTAVSASFAEAVDVVNLCISGLPNYGLRVVLDDFELLVVKPFYLEMMNVGAATASEAMLAEIADVARSLTPSDVIGLLRRHWRDRVMGAWYAVVVGGPTVRSSVCHALETSLGWLDAPSLAVAAVIRAGGGAMASMVIYHDRAVVARFGGEGVIRAAARVLRTSHGADNPLPEPTAADAETFEGLMRAASALHRHGGRRG